MLLDSDSLGNIYSPLKGVKELPSSPPDERTHAQSLKIEVPLSPPESTKPPPWKRKSVSFSDAVTKVIPQLPDPIPILEGDSMLDGIDAFFDKTIKPIAEIAARSVEQEQLQEADTARRVAVPVMDFSLPVAPWKAASQEANAATPDDAYKKTLEDMKILHLKDHAWPLSGKTNLELQWTPFPAALGKVELRESIRDDGSLTSYVTQPVCIDTDTLTCKPEGLRLFDELGNFHEEEIEEGAFPEGKDFESLVRKRKLNLEYEAEDVSPESQSTLSTSIEPPSILRGDSFSAMGSLADFMDLRMGTDRSAKVRNLYTFKRPPSRKPSMEIEHRDTPTENTDARLIESRAVIPLPKITIPRETRQFVVSAAFMKDRKLARQIQNAYPSAEFIERDYCLHQTNHPSYTHQRQVKHHSSRRQRQMKPT